MMRSRVNLVGERFDKLLVMEMVEDSRIGRDATWLCLCDCGGQVVKLAHNLKAGRRTGGKMGCRACSYKTRSDSRIQHGGCALRKERGLSRLYSIWSNMKSRCERKNADNYQWYGGRGIKVCDEWHDFATFQAWALSNGYADDLTIERVNHLGNYHPANCEWITQSENSKRMMAQRKEASNG